MSVYFNPFFIQTVSSFKALSSIIIGQQKKIAIIVGLALAFLTMCYIYLRNSKSSMKVSKNSPKTPVNITVIPKNNPSLTTKQTNFLATIKANPNDAEAYNNLANTLPSGGSIKLLDGSTKTKRELYLKAIELNPNMAETYINLATTLPSGGSIQLSDGSTKTEQELYLKAIKIKPKFAYAYHNLANTLPNVVQ